MAILDRKTNKGIIFYGPKVHIHEFDVYKILRDKNSICVCWDRSLETNYPNILDLQKRYAAFMTDESFNAMVLKNAPPDKQPLKILSKGTDVMDKVDFKDYNSYSNELITNI